MKRIEAIIPCDLIQEVEKALIHAGIEGLTLTSVYRTRSESDMLNASRQELLFGSPCCKLDVLVADDDLAKVSMALWRSSSDRNRILMSVMNLETTIRIRTGECEEAALR